MFYLANPRDEAVRAAMERLDIGFIDTPAQGNRRGDVLWCADNGCFGKGWPGYERWLAWLAKHAGDASTCLFATAPDVVGDANSRSCCRGWRSCTANRPPRPYEPLDRPLAHALSLGRERGGQHERPE